jgi:two-component system chemotaxis response regulator CheY
MKQRNPAVLVIDNDQSILTFLGRILTSAGYQVESALNGQTALVKIQNSVFDAIVCDVQMPVMDGLTFYRELEGISPELAARVIFSAGVKTPGAERLLRETGRGMLLKPFQMRELFHAVERVVNGCE